MSRFAFHDLFVPPPAAIVAPEILRQSSIAQFDRCALSYLFTLQQPAVLHQHAGIYTARGTLFHRWVARAIRQMRAEGWTSYPVEMGLELLLIVIAQRDVPDDEVVHLPMEELRWLRVLVTRWCEGGNFNAQRVLDMGDVADDDSPDARLYMKVPVPDGQGGMYERTISGRPDVVVADPPQGVIVVDWKSGWAPPSREVERAGRTEQDDQKLSDQGYAQQVIYGAILLANLPAIQQVTLREAYLMSGEYREATVHRWELERILDVLGGIISQMDAAIASGPDSDRWVPTGGTHCALCPRPRACPIKDWEGIPATEEEARLMATEWHVSAIVRKDRTPYLKGWVDAHGPLEIDHEKGRRMLGWPDWDGTSKARGNFRIYEPENAPASPFDERMEAALRDRG